MSEPTRRRRARVALCAAITFDGKLETSDLPPRALLDFLAPAEGDARLIDETIMRKTSSDWEQPVKILAPAAIEDLPRALDPHFHVWTFAPWIVRRWLCLGGPELFRALFDAGLVDDLWLLVRARVDGRRDAPTLSGPFTPEFFPRSISCRLRRMEVHGGDCFLHYTVMRQPRRRAA